MPDVKPLRFPSREGRASQTDQADFQVVCSGRRRTCALLSSPSPFVNNAVYHMQELKTAVEHWCQQGGKYPPHLDQDKNLRFPSGPESVTSAELFVEGFAISARGDPVFPPSESCALSPLLKTLDQVVLEVLCLVERLEADRQLAQEELQREKSRRNFLESKVHSISLWKQQEHGLVVQREHETRNRDLSELRWQLRSEKEKLEKLQVKLSHTKDLNHSLDQDVDLVQKQIPIMEEKLDLQRNIAEEINREQAKVDEEKLKTHDELVRLQEELRLLELEAKNEKVSLDRVITSMKEQLDHRRAELDELTGLEQNLCAETSAAVNRSGAAEGRSAAMTQRIHQLMEQQQQENKQISDLKCRLEDEVQRNRKLKEKLSALQEIVDKSKRDGEAEVSSIQEQLRLKCDALAALRKENLEREQSVEDHRRNINKSERCVALLSAERQLLLRRATDTEQQREQVQDEEARVLTQHTLTHSRLEQQLIHTCAQERRATIQMENLKKDLTGHVTVMELIKGQCAEMEEELTRQKRSSEVSNQRLQEELEEASSQTRSLQAKVQRLNEVTEHLEKIQREHKNKLLRLEQERRRRRDDVTAAQDLLSASVQKCSCAQLRICDLKTKSRECAEASRLLQETAETLPGLIQQIQMVFDALDFKNKSASVIMSTLQSDMTKSGLHTRRWQQTHSAHAAARTRDMLQLEDALRAALQENKRLAHQYERLRKMETTARRQEVAALSSRNQQHTHLLYYTQLSLLQKRMHKALVEYFRRRRLHSRAELDRCQALSGETERKIKTAQELVRGNFLTTEQNRAEPLGPEEEPSLGSAPL